MATETQATAAPQGGILEQPPANPMQRQYCHRNFRLLTLSTGRLAS